MKDTHAEKILKELLLTINENLDFYLKNCQMGISLIFREKIIYSMCNNEIIDTNYIKNLQISIEKELKGQIGDLLLEISNLFCNPEDYVNKVNSSAIF